MFIIIDVLTLYQAANILLVLELMEMKFLGFCETNDGGFQESENNAKMVHFFFCVRPSLMVLQKMRENIKI